MSEGDPQPNPVLTWVQRNQIATAFIASGLVVLLGVTLSSLFGGESPEVAVAVTTTTSTSVSTDSGQDAQSDNSDRPEVPQVDCRTLLTDDEIDEALFGPDASGPRGSFTFSEGETCRFEPNDESGNYIRIEPGDPTDFDDGTGSQTVEGVGDGARWLDDGTELGVLSVGVNVPDASIIYRIHIGRSDLDGAQRLAQATELALLALPRFPGTPAGPPEPLVDLCELVPDEQADQILAAYRDAHPATQDEIRVTDNFSDLVDLSEEGDANCLKLILAEIYIETQQGSPTDFEDGASMEGVAAERVDGLGDEAVWFAEVPYQGSFTAPHERGVLAVRLGDAMFRIVIAVPDTPSGDQLEIVEELARGALPQIPGAPAVAQDPEVVTFDEVPPELPPQSLHEVVYDGVAAGDWSEGEGLIAALEWMLAEDSTLEVGELPIRSGAAVLRAAQAYVAAQGDDTGAVEQLLDRLIARPEDLLPAPVPSDSSTSGLMVSRTLIAQSEEEDPCQGEDSCYVNVSSVAIPDLDQEKYSVYVAHPSLWEMDSIAITSFHDAVVKFESIGTLPPIDFALHNGNGIHSGLRPDGSCFVRAGQSLAGMPTNDLLQLVAEETSRCLIDSDLFLQLHENPNPWLEDGLAVYLGGVVWPLLNVEHKALPGLLAQEELWTTMTQRSFTNWVFFEYLHSRTDAEVVMNLLRGLPEGGDLAGALASVRDMAQVYHELGQALSDSAMPDIGGGVVPYGPESFQVILSAPKAFDSTLSRFSTKRYRLEVPPGSYACGVTVDSESAQVSWRTGAPGGSGDWSSDVPDTLEDVSVLLVTSVEDEASFSFEASEVGEDPDCEEDEEETTGLGGDVIGGILELCDFICDPSGYYFQPREF